MLPEGFSEPQGILLLVDDEINILNSLRRIFAPLNYVIHATNSCKEAFDILEQNEVDIIISDMRMPEMDGATFLKKTFEKWPNISRILLTGFSDIDSTISAINEGQIEYYLNKPWQPNEIEQVVQHIMEKRILRKKNKLLTDELVTKNKELKFLNENLEQIVAERTLKLEKAYKGLKKIYDSTVQILSSLSAQRDNFSPGYSQVIARLAKETAVQLGLSAAEVQSIYIAGLLHSIGKIGLSESITSKPYKYLTRREREQYEKYPVLGETILLGYPPLHKVAQIVAGHREYLNGHGYPAKLKGNDISIGSKILSIIVDYAELQCGHLLPEKLSKEQALGLIQSNSHERYDQAVVEMFLKAVGVRFDSESDEPERILIPNALMPGMVVSRDIYTDSGLKLISKGFLLNELSIAALKRIGSIEIYVKE